MYFLYHVHAGHKCITMFLSAPTLETFLSANLGIIIRQEGRIKNNENSSIINEETDFRNLYNIGINTLSYYFPMITQ